MLRRISADDVGVGDLRRTGGCPSNGRLIAESRRDDRHRRSVFLTAGARNAVEALASYGLFLQSRCAGSADQQNTRNHSNSSQHDMPRPAKLQKRTDMADCLVECLCRRIVWRVTVELSSRNIFIIRILALPVQFSPTQSRQKTAGGAGGDITLVAICSL
jgi:hypothetical protein